MIVMKVRMFYFLSILFFLMRPTASFKSYFDQFQTIMLNSTSWLLEVKYKFGDLEDKANELQYACLEAPESLKVLKQKIEKFRAPFITSGLYASKHYKNYQEAKDFCNEILPNCHLPIMKDLQYMQDIWEVMDEHDYDLAHVDYSQEDGNLFRSGEAIPDQDPFYNQNFDIVGCPRGFKLYETKNGKECFQVLHSDHHNKNGFWHNYGSRSCLLKDSKLFEISNASDLLDLEFVFPHGPMKEFWVDKGNQASPDDLPLCSSSWPYKSTNNQHMTYNPSKKCVSFYPFKKIKGIICHTAAVYKGAQSNTPNLRNIFSNKFDRKAASMKLTRLGRYIFSDATFRVPTICQCKVNGHYNNVYNAFKLNLRDKVDSAIKHIEMQCDRVLSPLKKSPFIIYNPNPVSNSKRKKRAILSFFLSIFGALTGVFISLGTGLSAGAAKVAHAVPSAISSSGKILPSLRTTSYGVTAASAIGITALALDDYLSSDAVNLNSTDTWSHTTMEIGQNVDAYTSILVDFIEHSDVSNVRDVLINDQFKSLTAALKATVHLSSTSSAVDRLVMEFETMSRSVQEHFDAYQAITDMLTSRLFSHPLLQTTLLNATADLPDGYAFLADTTIEIMKTATVKHELESDSIKLKIAIPIISENAIFFLFRAHSLPYLTKDGERVRPIFEKPYFAFNKNSYNYALLDSVDLMSCHFKDKYLCPNLPLYDSDTFSCVYSHFINDPIKSGNCHFEKLKDHNVFELTSNNILHYSLNKMKSATIFCKDEGGIPYIETKYLNGTAEFYVKPGCQVKSSGFLALNPAIPSKLVTENDFRPKVLGQKFVEIIKDNFDDDEIYIPFSDTSPSSFSLINVISNGLSLGDTFVLLCIILLIIILVASCFCLSKFWQKLIFKPFSKCCIYICRSCKVNCSNCCTTSDEQNSHLSMTQNQSRQENLTFDSGAQTETSSFMFQRCSTPNHSFTVTKTHSGTSPSQSFIHNQSLPNPVIEHSMSVGHADIINNSAPQTLLQTVTEEVPNCTSKDNCPDCQRMAQPPPDYEQDMPLVEDIPQRPKMVIRTYK